MNSYWRQILVGLLTAHYCCGLQPCNEQSIYSGSWRFDGPLTPQHAYGKCPQTRKFLMSEPSLMHQIKKYSCFNATFVAAEYMPHCQMVGFREAALALRKKKVQIMFMGDSLMAQLFISMQCKFEEYRIPTDSILFHAELFFRPDFPCIDECLLNSTFLKEAGHEVLYNPCYACRNGVKTAFDDSFFESGKGWPSKIPNSITTLVLGSGAWQHISDKYYEMLVGIRGYLKKLIGNGMEIYWLDLPPMDMYADTDPDKYTYYGWSKFSSYNEMAKSILAPSGVVFLNTSQATRSRKVHDPSIVSDFMHWCNPGSHSVPTFIAHTILTLILSSYT